MNRYLPYNPHLKQASRELRSHSTFGEVLLWNQLKARRFNGYQFYRQKPILNFIVDFYCPALKLVIEIDGAYHNHEEVADADAGRSAALQQYSLSILRFTEMDVRLNMPLVSFTLQDYVDAYEIAHPECKERHKRAKK